MKNFNISGVSSGKGYSKGGLVDYTGTAVVHGSHSRPEAFLNADQTAMFAQLAKGLQYYYNRNGVNSSSTSSNEGVTIENITIQIDGVLNADNVQNTANDLATAIKNSLQRTGLALNKR
jgi:hypothetical protein